MKALKLTKQGDPSRLPAHIRLRDSTKCLSNGQIEASLPITVVIKAALRQSFSECVYCMQLRFQSNYLDWLKPK
jgi:hypothetical protein